MVWNIDKAQPRLEEKISLASDRHEDTDSPDVREILISEVDRSFKSKYRDVIFYFSVRQAVEKVGVRCSHCFRYERNRLIVNLSIVFS